MQSYNVIKPLKHCKSVPVTNGQESTKSQTSDHAHITHTVLSPQIFDRQCSVCVLEYIQQYPRPVAAVAEFAQIREWLLR